MTEPTTELISTKIFEIRGQKIMLDRDLAELYQVETKYLKRQVNRNKEMFPDDFMFMLSQKEFNDWRCQNVTSNSSDKMGLRYSPYAFTYNGIAMLSSVLKSKVAIQVNIMIMRTFVVVQQQVHKNPNLYELKEELNRLERQIINVEDTFKLQQRIDTNSQNQKIIQLTEQVGKLTQIMNEFQDNNLIIKRPEEGGGKG